MLPDAEPQPALARRLKLACAFLVGALAGFRIAMHFYSGPSIAVGLGISVGVGILVTLLWDYRAVVLLVAWLLG